MAAIMLQTIPSFYAEISEESLFISAKNIRKFIVCKDYCIAQMCREQSPLTKETEEWTKCRVLQKRGS